MGRKRIRPGRHITGRTWIAVVGTPCSGTRYVAECLQHCGVRVLHEDLGAHGISCGFFLFGSRVYLYDNFEIEHVVRLVRHPLRVAETLPGHAVQPEELDWTCPWEHEDRVVSALRWWVLAQEKIPRDAPMLRVGTPSLAGDWRALLEHVLGLTYAALDEIPVRPRRKPQRWDPLTWADWRRIDPAYAERGRELWEWVREAR